VANPQSKTRSMATTEANGRPAPDADDVVSKAPEGTVIPPKDVRRYIEKTADYIARNYHARAALIEKLRSSGTAAKTAFLDPEDPYHNFYQWRLEEYRTGRSTYTPAAAGRPGESGETGVSSKGRERKAPEQPPDFAFSARMPNINAQDLEVVRLTALFTAKNGRSWMVGLSQREVGNFQFDFLRPQHSLYNFFNRLADQYRSLLDGDIIDGGRPKKKRIAELEANVNNKFTVLERAKKRAEWVKWQETQRQQKEERDEKERRAYLETDWHDFSVAETIVFDAADDDVELAVPTTKNDLMSASLEQKAAMTIDPHRRLEEAFPSFDDPTWNEPHEQQPAGSGPAVQVPTPQPPTPQVYATPPPATTPYHPPPGMDNAPNRLAERQAEQDRARQAQEAARATPTDKIRIGYVPRAGAKRQQANTSICPNCKQAIDNNEIAEHMRIEMLDPRWRDQNRIMQARSATTNLNTADVANNLKRLASQRTDVFDQAAKRSRGGPDDI
jgi:splicing factor 3A subunit 1